MKQFRRRKFEIKRSYKKIIRASIFVFCVCLVIAVFVLAAQFANTLVAQEQKGQLVAPQSTVLSIDDFKKKLAELNVQYDAIHESSSGATVIVDVSDKTTAYFSPFKDINWQVSSLQQILSRLTIENKKPEYVDLRFDKPIVKF